LEILYFFKLLIIYEATVYLSRFGTSIVEKRVFIFIKISRCCWKSKLYHLDDVFSTEIRNVSYNGWSKGDEEREE
jgi:hypothetical protein